MRTPTERKEDVLRLVRAAQTVVRDRAKIAGEIAAATGLTPEGVELGFTRHVEVAPSDADLEALVAAAGDAPAVYVVLSANVFTAPLRAIAIARAASERVVVRPSRRDPAFARALVAAAAEPEITLAPQIAFESIRAGEVHVYGRDETIAAIGARLTRPALRDSADPSAAPSVTLRGHGAGMGIALITLRADLDGAAAQLAEDVIAFDQRGCLSPRIACVEGDLARGERFARALYSALTSRARHIPRGALSDDERRDATRYADTVAFAGGLLRGDTCAVGFAPPGVAALVPPSGRHVHVTVGDLNALAASVAPLAASIVAIGTDHKPSASQLADLCAPSARPPPIASADVTQAGVAQADVTQAAVAQAGVTQAAVAQSGVTHRGRIVFLGQMQTPPLDGPVDLRPKKG